jgi:RNA polymerase sigma-70 factor (ECF subfamily)
VSQRQASAEVRGALAEAHRREWAFVLAATVRLAGVDVAEECAQDTFVAALTTWGQRGIPVNPGAWLTATARRRALDTLRRDQTLRRKLPLLVGTDPATSAPLEWEGEGEEADMSQLADDRLRLIFTCCHPALAPRGSGRVDPAAGVRADHPRDRPRVPGQRAHHGRPHHPGEKADHPGPDPRPRPPGP